MRLYAAYGSNLNLNQMVDRCPQATVYGIAALDGYRLSYKGHSGGGCYLTIEKSPGHFVPLGIFETTATDEKLLDSYEGWPSLYYKATMKNLRIFNIKTRKFENKEVYIYIMNDHEYGIPFRSYIKTCTQGYMDFNFPQHILDEALDYSKKKMYEKWGLCNLPKLSKCKSRPKIKVEPAPEKKPYSYSYGGLYGDAFGDYEFYDPDVEINIPLPTSPTI